MAEKYSVNNELFQGVRTIPGTLQQVVDRISVWKGLEDWTAQKPAKVAVMNPRRYMGSGYVEGTPRDNCYRVRLDRGNSKIILFFCCSNKGIPVFGDDFNTEFAGAINGLVIAGYKVYARMTLEQCNPGYEKPPSGPIFVHHTTHRGQVGGVKDGVKITFSCKSSYGYMQPSNIVKKWQARYEVKSKPRGANHYTLIDGRGHNDLETALKVAETETLQKQALDYTKLPEPGQYGGDNYETTTSVWDPRVQGKTPKRYGIARANALLSAIVLEPAILHQDGSFTFDTDNPANDNVWFVMFIGTYDGHSHTIAINNRGWYKLAGRKYLRIDPNGQGYLKLMPMDQELITMAIQTWSGQDGAANLK